MLLYIAELLINDDALLEELFVEGAVAQMSRVVALVHDKVPTRCEAKHMQHVIVFSHSHRLS